MLQYKNIPLLLAALFFVVSSLILFFYVNSKGKKDKVSKAFLEQLKFANGKNITYGDINSANRFFLFNKYYKKFGKNFIKAGIVSDKYTDTQVGNIFLLLNLVLYMIFVLLFQNFGIGILPVGIMIIFSQLFSTKKMKEKQTIFDDQIPGFLSLLKSNIQAGETPERSLISAIENTDSPLYDELRVAKALTETGSFHAALHTLREQTDNPTLKFLCGCIELSSTVGANLEEQIVIIEETLESNRALKRKLEIAISQNTPLLYVSMILIPGLFLFAYLSNDQARAFWFHGLVSWVVFSAILIIYGLGIFMVNRIIQKVSKF